MHTHAYMNMHVHVWHMLIKLYIQLHKCDGDCMGIGSKDSLYTLYLSMVASIIKLDLIFIWYIFTLRISIKAMICLSNCVSRLLLRNRPHLDCSYIFDHLIICIKHSILCFYHIHIPKNASLTLFHHRQ